MHDIHMGIFFSQIVRLPLAQECHHILGHIETELRKADRSVGVNCFIFSDISSGTA